MFRRLIIGLAFLIAIPAATPVGAALGNTGGRMSCELDGRVVVFPVLGTEIRAEVRGDLAAVTVEQTFANPTGRPVHAVYDFSLNPEASVYALTVETGDEHISAEIRRIEEAGARFIRAHNEGNSGAWPAPNRLNLFTQDIANLMPGPPVRVTIQYVQPVPKVNGAYQLALPLAAASVQPSGYRVSPEHDRPEGAEEGLPEASLPEARAGEWFEAREIEELAGISVPGEPADPQYSSAARVKLRVNLDAGMPVERLEYGSRNTDMERLSPEKRIITLDGNGADGGRDFILRYALAGPTIRAGMLTHVDRRGGFFNLLIEPPARPDALALTDLKIDWGGLDVRDVIPDKPPDLVAGRSIRVLGRFGNPGWHTITVTGRSGGRRVRIPFRIDIPGRQAGDLLPAIPLSWAKAKIAEYTQRPGSAGDPTMKDEIARLGLDYSLVTPWTAFVAVTRGVHDSAPLSVRRTGGSPLRADSPAETSPPRPAGSSVVTAHRFSAGSMPDSAAMPGLLLAACGLAAEAWRRWRKHTHA